MAEDGKTQEGKEGAVERLVINAPEFLEAGQNFLDQEPFNVIVDKSVKSSGADPELIKRVILSGVRHRFYYGYGVDLMDEFRRINADPNAHKVLAKEWNREKRRITYHAIGLINEELKQYPSWEEYIYTQCVQSLYGSNGDWNPVPQWKDPEREAPRSYASWIAKKLRAERNARILGIEEIFPQDIEQESPALRPEKGPGYRRWVILKASEIEPK